MNDNELVDLCAIRYALGRRTYITEFISSFFINKLSEKSDSFLKVLKTDLSILPNGDSCDLDAWMRLKTAVISELNKRKE